MFVRLLRTAAFVNGTRKRFPPSGLQSAIASERCGNCRFWEQSAYAVANNLNNDEWGVGGPHCNGTVSNCRRRAPTIQQTRDDRLFGSEMWPTTKREAWCGEWQARP